VNTSLLGNDIYQNGDLYQTNDSKHESTEVDAKINWALLESLGFFFVISILLEDDNYHYFD